MTPDEHLLAAQRALDAVRPQVGQITRWGRHLAVVLTGGGRLLAVGNGGSAAQAQHLTSELVGRYCDERQPLERDRPPRRDVDADRPRQRLPAVRAVRPPGPRPRPEGRRPRRPVDVRPQRERARGRRERAPASA